MSPRSCLAAFAAAVMSATGCSNPAPPAQSARQDTPLTLKVTFDGGYAFIQQEDESMTVDSLNSQHPMILWLRKGSVEGQSQATTDQVISKLDGKRLALQTQGSKGVALPPVREMPVPADRAQCRNDPEGAQVDNGFYWPELNSWTETSVNEDPKLLNAQVALHGGRLKILKAGGCFEVRDAKSRTVVHRPMVPGNQSVRFEDVVPEAKMTLTIEPLHPGAARQSIVILPDANHNIELRIGHRPDGPAIEPPKTPIKVEDFDMFNALLGLSQSNPHSLWMYRSPAPFLPGHDCIPVFFTKKKPNPACLSCPPEGDRRRISD